MAVVKDLLCANGEDRLDFGDYLRKDKAKLHGFMFKGDEYYIKTCAESTRLEKNGMLLYESVPGTAAHEFLVREDEVTFSVEGNEDAQITLGLAEDTEYIVYVNEKAVGQMLTNKSGKLSFSVEPGEHEVQVKVRN